MHRTGKYRWVTGIALMCIAPLAAAHGGLHTGNSMVDGFMHPFTGLDHMLAALAAGYWAARRSDHGLRGMLFFLGLFFAGLLLGIAGVKLQFSPAGPLLAMLIMLLVTVVIAHAGYALHALFGSIALWHGMAHINEMPADAALAGYSVGLFTATFVLLLAGLIIRQVMHARSLHTRRYE